MPLGSAFVIAIRYCAPVPRCASLAGDDLHVGIEGVEGKGEGEVVDHVDQGAFLAALNDDVADVPPLGDRGRVEGRVLARLPSDDQLAVLGAPVFAQVVQAPCLVADREDIGQWRQALGRLATIQERPARRIVAGIGIAAIGTEDAPRGLLPLLRP